MKKTVSAFLAGLVVASVPYVMLARADAQGAGPQQRGQGQFQGGPGQLPPGQGGAIQDRPNMGGMPQGVPPITTLISDNDYLYAGAGNWLYKIYKNDMTVTKRIALVPQQRPDRAVGGK
jgi:hypothetical protein